jgi:hypothetical protein
MIEVAGKLPARSFELTKLEKGKPPLIFHVSAREKLQHTLELTAFWYHATSDAQRKPGRIVPRGVV